jgi:hypothetical protein
MLLRKECRPPGEVKRETGLQQPLAAPIPHSDTGVLRRAEDSFEFTKGKGCAPAQIFQLEQQTWKISLLGQNLFFHRYHFIHRLLPVCVVCGWLLHAMTDLRSPQPISHSSQCHLHQSLHRASLSLLLQWRYLCHSRSRPCYRNLARSSTGCSGQAPQRTVAHWRSWA